MGLIRIDQKPPGPLFKGEVRLDTREIIWTRRKKGKSLKGRTMPMICFLEIPKMNTTSKLSAIFSRRIRTTLSGIVSPGSQVIQFTTRMKSWNEGDNDKHR